MNLIITLKDTVAVTVCPLGTHYDDIYCQRGRREKEEREKREDRGREKRKKREEREKQQTREEVRFIHVLFINK